MQRLPFYAKPAHSRFKLNSHTTIGMMDVVRFLRFVVDRDRLEISEYLGQMSQDPFFLVAATGLGKTVAVPLHDLILQIQRIGSQPNPAPRIWVVEPRIPIAVNQTKFMNSLWNAFWQKQERSKPPLFGCISSKGTVNPRAPIMFVTTGIFGKYAQGDKFNPYTHRIIIDEAHVTVEQSPEVELGIALFKARGGIVDYMSATVDTDNLEEALGVTNIIRADKSRSVIWKHNLGRPIDDVVNQLIDATLIRQDLASEYYPHTDSFNEAKVVRQALTETGRSHGLLIVVNSYAGNQSDTQRLASIIRVAYPHLAVLQLASEIVRDVRRCTEFEDNLRRIEASHNNYVILATSVVEMGITFPTLDYVVTMDSGYDQETIGDVTFPVEAPLGVNSLLQRMGRVGRRHAGIAYISLEVGADYARLSDVKLNNGALAYEPISFPMSSAPLMPLAYYACKQRWSNVQEAVTELCLPSRLHESADRINYLYSQIGILSELGIYDQEGLTPFGKRMEQWIGRADLAYTTQLQRRFEQGADLSEVVFWVVTTALSNIPIVTLRTANDFFVDYDGSHAAVERDLNVWSDLQNEDLVAFYALSWLSNLAPDILWRQSPLSDTSNEEEESLAQRWCMLAGVDIRKVQKATRVIQDMWELFGKVNRYSPRIRELSGDATLPLLTSLDWSNLADKLPADKVHQQLQELHGNRKILVEPSESGIKWEDSEGWYNGLISQDDTPVLLAPGEYQARPVPSRKSKQVASTWQLAHLSAPSMDNPLASMASEANAFDIMQAIEKALTTEDDIQGLKEVQATIEAAMADGSIESSVDIEEFEALVLEIKEEIQQRILRRQEMQQIQAPPAVLPTTVDPPRPKKRLRNWLPWNW